jgi:hypothetical protein
MQRSERHDRARVYLEQEGGACLLCPGISDVNLFRYCKRVINFDAQIANGAFDLGVAEQKLDGTEIASAAVYERRLGSARRVCPKMARVQPDAGNPFGPSPDVIA